MRAVDQVAPTVGIATACEAVGVPRASYYRRRRPSKAAVSSETKPARRPSPRALSSAENQQVLDTLHSERFVDTAPAEVYATLLDEGTHLCSTRTMYRILAAEGEVRERRNQLSHPRYTKPELLATGPNQVWSWDLTKLRARQKWTYYHLYVLLDLFSRFVVGWMLAHRECGKLAAKLIEQTCKKQGIKPGQLTVHGDRGSAPKSKTVGQMFINLGVEASFSRPRVSNDNPFSEAQFKTFKYQPEYPPDRFDDFDHGLDYCRRFFDWYCNHHRHSGIAMLTPADVHYGRAEIVLAGRQRALDAAYAAHPERFVKGPPRVTPLPEAVWINPPEDLSRSEIQLH